jgi:hypothetical protein
MPATTPLGIQYPCSGEQIDCDALETYAETTQQAITDTQALVTQALNPAATWVRRAAAQAIAVNVSTAVSFDQEMYDTSGMFTLGAPTVLTVVTPGTYLVNFGGQVSSFPTTLTSLRFALALNGTEVAYAKSDAGTASIGANGPMYVSQLLPSLSAGNTISANVLFTGSGSLGIAAYMAATLVSTT